jgi:NAD(P)-dependent dehydrogenase (short-subunit alcohol dehydrogenase family)
MKDLSGKVAVITGGAAGIGLAMAEAFAAEDMKLVLADVEQGALDRAVRNLSDRGVEVIGVRCDVSKFDQVEALARAAMDRFGKIHVLCNNAGVSITGPIFKMSMDDWRWVYDVNVWGVIHGIKAFVPILMEQAEPAHVVNTASLAAFNGTGDHAPYCSSKAAVLSLSQALYSEMAAFDTKIGVSVVCPGMVDTAINKSWRNRPEDDTPWSDREYADEEHVKASEQFQSAGVPPSEIARVTLEAVKEGRFYVFNGERSGDFLKRFLTPILKAENPPVQTWGPDLRAASAGPEANG